MDQTYLDQERRVRFDNQVDVWPASISIEEFKKHITNEDETNFPDKTGVEPAELETAFSKYTDNDDMFKIWLSTCRRCSTEGGYMAIYLDEVIEHGG